MPRTAHPKKEVEEAIRYAETNGWPSEVVGSHAWAGCAALMTMSSAAAATFAS